MKGMTLEKKVADLELQIADLQALILEVAVQAGVTFDWKPQVKRT